MTALLRLRHRPRRSRPRPAPRGGGLGRRSGTTARPSSGWSCSILFRARRRSRSSSPSLRRSATRLQFQPAAAPSCEHWLGTTGLGQDMFAQLIYGTRPVAPHRVGRRARSPRSSRCSSEYPPPISAVLPTTALAAHRRVPGAADVPADHHSGNYAGKGTAGDDRCPRDHRLVLRRQPARAGTVAAQPGLPRVGPGPRRASSYIIVVEVLPTMISLIVANFLGAALYAVLTAAGLQFLGLGDPNSLSWGTMLYWAQNQGALQTGLPRGRSRRVWRRAARCFVRPAQLRVRRDQQPRASAGSEATCSTSAASHS